MHPRPSASRLWRTQDSAARPDSSSPAALLGILRGRQSPQRHFRLEGTPTMPAGLSRFGSRFGSVPPSIGCPTLCTRSPREGSPPAEDCVGPVRFPAAAYIPAASDPAAAEDAGATIPDLQPVGMENILDMYLQLLPAPARIQ